MSAFFGENVDGFGDFCAGAEGVAAKAGEHQAHDEAGRDADRGIDDEAACDTTPCIASSVDDQHVGERDIGGGDEEGEGRRGEWIVPADDLEDDARLGGEGEGLEQKGSNERKDEDPWGVREHRRVSV